MADIQRYPSVKPLTLATDLTSAGTLIKTTSKTTFNDAEIEAALFSTDYVRIALQSDDRKRVEFMLVTAASILNIDTTGAVIYRRGLNFTAQGDATDFDEIAANKLDWTAGETKVYLGTNPPLLYGSFPNRYNDETVTGDWTFSTRAPLIPTETSSDTGRAGSIGYINSVAIAGAPDASTTVKGISKLSTAPVSPTDPIAVGTNDTRMPTQDENDALVGRSGTPSASQPYETVHDSSNAATITASTISFTASTKTIADSGSGFVTANFIAGTQITVTGPGVNNGTYTIVSVAAADIVVAETLIDESAGASVTITTVTANKLVRHSSTSQVKVPLVPVASNDAVSKNYADSGNIITIPLGESFTGATTPQPAYIVNDLFNPVFQMYVPTGRVTLDNSGQERQAVSFTPRANVSSSSLILLMAISGSPSDNCFVTIETDSAGSPSGTPIANGTSNNVAGSGLSSTAGTYQTFSFSSAFSLSANTKYWIVLQRSSSLADSNYYFAGSSDDATSDYASFAGKYYNGSTWQSSRVMWFNIVTTAGGSMSLWQSDANATPSDNGFVKSFQGFCTTTGSAGDSGTLVIGGKVGGFSGLLAYSDYFVSTTKGALSNTNNGQFVGTATSSTEISIPQAKSGVWTYYGQMVSTLNGNSATNTPIRAPYDGVFTLSNDNGSFAVSEGRIIIADASNMITNAVNYYYDETTNGQRTVVTIPIRKGQFIKVDSITGSSSLLVRFFPRF